MRRGPSAYEVAVEIWEAPLRLSGRCQRWKGLASDIYVTVGRDLRFETSAPSKLRPFTSIANASYFDYGVGVHARCPSIYVLPGSWFSLRLA